MRAIVLGAAGQLGIALAQSAPPGAECIALDRSSVDVADRGAVDDMMSALRPDVVVNAAAYTNVDQAETDAVTAFRVNADGAAHVAAAAARQGAHVIHVSTDYVFDGTSTRPYRPSDPTAPLGAYGRSKLAGERAVLDATGGAGLVVRTAWLYSATGRNFLRTMLRAMRGGQPVRVVFDQTGTPTSAPGLARALWRAAELRLDGVHHWTAAGTASWYDFAVVIGEAAHAAGLVSATPAVVPIGTDDWPTPAARPAYSVLDCRTTWNALGTTATHWHTDVHHVIRELAHG